MYIIIIKGKTRQAARPERELKMKNYQVFYWIKKNSREYLEHMFVSANSAKDAC